MGSSIFDKRHARSTARNTTSTPHALRAHVTLGALALATGLLQAPMALAQTPPSQPAPTPSAQPPGSVPAPQPGATPAGSAAALPDTVNPGAPLLSSDSKEPQKSQAALELESRLASMRRGGGLTADAVATRAVANSSQVKAKQQTLEATEADVRQTRSQFYPTLSLSARYTRLSSIPIPVLGGFGDGSLIISATPSAAPRPLRQNEVLLAVPTPSFSFPVFLNQYSLGASLAVPLSDYVLRTSRAIAASSLAHDGAELDEKATRRAVARDARVAYYQWIRTLGVSIVAQQSLEQASGHAADTQNAFAAGVASKADVLRAQGQLEMTKLFQQRAQTQVTLASQQISVAMGDPMSNIYEVGEDILVKPVHPKYLDDEQAALAEASSQRLELQNLRVNEQALRDAASLVQVGAYPRLDAQANAQYANPNQRFFPQQDKFKGTWDVGVVLSWTPTQLFGANAQADSYQAKANALAAQRAQMMDALKLEVARARHSVLDAEYAVGASELSLGAAEEGYRVRRELYRAGRATEVEVTDAETELMRARLDLVNAHIDLAIANVEFEHALGRDKGL